MKTSFRVEGFDSLNATLSEMSKGLAKGALTRIAVNALKDEFVPVASAMAPDDPATGGNDLKSSIVAGPASRLNIRQKRLNKKRDDKSFGEGFAGTADPAGIAQEFGNVNHGPQPFMRPALRQTTKPIMDHVAKNTWPEVEKTALRAAKRRAAKAARAG
jgi:hypothetical protein